MKQFIDKTDIAVSRASRTKITTGKYVKSLKEINKFLNVNFQLPNSGTSALFLASCY